MKPGRGMTTSKMLYLSSSSEISALTGWTLDVLMSRSSCSEDISVRS
jgi:hypothetical protein